MQGVGSNLDYHIDGIHWDRIGSRDPSFEVFELHGDRLDGYLLHAGGKKSNGAHTFFFEASFLTTHQNLTVSAGHLAAKACNEIAAEVTVQRLVPFHLSKRFHHQIEHVSEEVRIACPEIDVDRDWTGTFYIPLCQQNK